MPHAVIGGLRIHYQQAGQGPDVLLVHGLTSSVAIWVFSGIIEALAPEYRVTAYDLRGHGDSDVPERGYTSADLAEELRAFHAELGLGPALAVGHSFGGVVAMHAAWRSPAVLRGLVLSDCFFPGLRHLEPGMGQAKVWQGLRDSLAEAGADIGPTVHFSRLFLVVRDLDGEQLAVIRRKLGPVGAAWLKQLARLAGTAAGDEAFAADGFGPEEIAAVRQPVVALYDEHTPFAATCRFLQERLAHCTADVVPGAEHLALLQNSAAFIALVRKHLRRMAAWSE